MLGLALSAEHGHSHGPASYTNAFAIGIALNPAFVAAEAVYGLRANSLALLADAGHNFTDVLGLLLAWGAAVLSKRLPTVRRTAHHAMAHDHAHVHDEHHRHDHED